MKPVIHAVEDDAAIQELYAYSLEGEFEFRCFGDGASFLAALQKGSPPDLVLLDVMLPGDDGFAVLARLKGDASTSRIPVIMVSARNEELTKVRGLNVGADDYVSKPFGVMELIARIKANLRKGGKGAARSVGYKDIVIDDARHRITVGGSAVQATLKEYNLLAYLCENQQKALPREEIFRNVWGDGFMGESRTLDIHIKTLRAKLSEAGSEASIQTIRGVGYMLI